MVKDAYILIAGSRDFNDYDYLKQCMFSIVNKLHHHPSTGEIMDLNITVVSGAAQGADSLGEKWAEENGHKLIRYPADWSIGRKAGPIRNAIMVNFLAEMKEANNVTCAVFFWDGKSRGTKNCIEECEERKIATKIYEV